MRSWVIFLCFCMIWNYSVFAGQAWSQELRTSSVFSVADEQTQRWVSEPVGTVPFCADACWSASFILPGSGQLFLGESLRGWGFMAGTLVAPWVSAVLAMALLEALARPDWSGPALQASRSFFVWAAFLVALGIYVWNIFDAYSLQEEKIRQWRWTLQSLQHFSLASRVADESFDWYLQVRVAHF